MHGRRGQKTISEGPLDEGQQQLVIDHMRLMYWWVNKLSRGKSQLVREAMQDQAVETLIHCSKGWKSDRGVPFASYLSTSLKRKLKHTAHLQLRRPDKTNTSSLNGAEVEADLPVPGQIDPCDYRELGVGRLVMTAEVLDRCKAATSPRDWLILELLHVEGWALEEVADLWCLTRQRLWQIEQRILLRLRTMMILLDAPPVLRVYSGGSKLHVGG